MSRKIALRSLLWIGLALRWAGARRPVGLPAGWGWGNGVGSWWRRPQDATRGLLRTAGFTTADGQSEFGQVVG